MHYRAGLNMIPLIEWYRSNPDDLFLLEISMGAIAGQMSNIDESGAPGFMFHASPHVMDFDPLSGDYGLGFFGNALQSGLYYVVDSEFGRLCFLCDVVAAPSDSSEITLLPRDAYHRNAFFEPIGLYLQTEAGTIAALRFDPSFAQQRIYVTLEN